MYTYYFLLLLVVFICFVNYNHSKKLSIAVCSFFLILFSCLRADTVGGDLLNYLPLYESIGDMTWKEIFEERTKYGYIFTVYLKLWTYIGESSFFFKLATALPTLLIYSFFINNYSKIPWLSLFILITFGFYTNTYNSVRSSLSVAVGLLSIHNLIRGKNFYFLIYYLIALEIHLTIAPLCLLFLIRNRSVKLPVVFVSIILALCVSKFLNLDFFSFLTAAYDDNSYTDLLISQEASGSGTGLFIFYVITTIGLCYLNKQSNKSDRILLFGLLLATCLQTLSTHFSFLVRMTLFYSIYLIVLIPNSIFDSPIRSNRRIYICAVVLFFIIYFKIFVMTPSIDVGYGYLTNSQGSIPYVFSFVH